ARNWALTYSKRDGVDDDDEGNLARGPSGYLWDACARSNLTYRSYGEYGARVSQPDGSVRMEGRVPGLVGHTSPEFGIVKAGKSVRDTDRVDVFLKEFAEYDKDGSLPRFIVMSLGEDHTTGTTPGTYTPEACPDAVGQPPPPDRPRGPQRRAGLRRRAVEADGLQRVRPDRRFRAQRDPLAGGQGPGRPAPARRPPRHRVSAGPREALSGP